MRRKYLIDTKYSTTGPKFDTEWLIDCGAVVCKGLKKIACYRDKKGKLHKVSAVCPHLGALVRWNESEHCWECPAHGSRFNTDGEVIQGPTNHNLEKCSE